MSKNNSTGIYGIYCKSGDVYATLNTYEGKLVGAVLAQDNSSVVLYKNQFEHNNYVRTDYVEAHRNSNIANFKTSGFIRDNENTDQVIYKSQDNSFINFPIPIFDSENLNNSTGFDSTISEYIKLSGQATSLLYNNGFEFYLTKLKNGLCLSNIDIKQNDITKLSSYLEILPRNLNGYNLNIYADNITQPISGDTISNAVCITGFYGGNINISRIY